ncbi:37S ribosomal protein S35, mitochondrial [Psilocybe cubensis]|uniref:37S ribosomal protein S35, mitochondrial n=2 Tax=Psilocybe cubensis TaxID=181762 RepID=A0ACB8HGV1_PSICU|nr:37S ribosomal protein S35, mitochondrial [Psilocybe cubensis]KAH9486394.1 37S ribosomal protein S35, mitochondrial [Psilocybe cubensis]
MFCHHLSSFRPCLRSVSRPVASTSRLSQYRSNSTVVTSEKLHDSEDGVSEFEEADSQDADQGDKGPRNYKEFMATIGPKFRYASPQNWLAPKTPFPMNPSFKPPPPISDVQKDIIFQQFLADPLLHSPRRLAQRYHLSLKRVDAILRLKGLERHFTKGIPLQTGFQIGMDRLLNAWTHPKTPFYKAGVKSKSKIEEREDVSQADALEQAEKRDAARYRYERLYWESTPEDGREPIVPGVLEAVKTRALLREQRRKKAAARLLQGRLPKSPWIRRPSRPSFVSWRQGRVATRFVDVGAEFLSVEELNKNTAPRRHRQEQRQKKAAEKMQKILNSKQ